MSTHQEFKFQYTVVSNTATLDARDVRFKMGLRTQKTELSSLKHLYIQHQMAGDLQELILTYSHGHKLKRIRVYSNEGEVGFDQTVAAILARRPDIDIRHMPEKEALAMMGAVNTEKWSAISVPIIVTLVMAVLLYPTIKHGFDSGHEKITVAQLAKGEPLSSRNLTLTKGQLCLDTAIEKTTTKEGSTTVRYYIPVIPKRSRCDKATVAVVLETDELTPEEDEELVSSKTIDGILKNVWWEGLGSKEHDFFVEEQGVKMAEEVALVEYQGKPGDYKLIVFVVLGLTIVIMIGVTLFMWFKRKG